MTVDLATSILFVVGVLCLLGAVTYVLFLLYYKSRQLAHVHDLETGDSYFRNLQRIPEGIEFDEEDYEYSILKPKRTEMEQHSTWLFGQRPLLHIDARNGAQIPAGRLFEEPVTPEGEQRTAEQMFGQWVNANAVKQHAEAQRGPWPEIIKLVGILAVVIVGFMTLGTIFGGA